MKPAAPLLAYLPRRNLISLRVSLLSQSCRQILSHPDTLANCQLFMSLCLVSFIYCVSTEA